MLGLVVSVALILSIPIYAEGIYHRILMDKMTGEPSLGLRPYPPFSLMFRYIGGSFQSLPWENMGPADSYFSDRAVRLLGLPKKFLVRHFKTDNYHLLPKRDTETEYENANIYSLSYVSFGFVTDFYDHVTIVEGREPQIASVDGDAPVEVLVSEYLADELGLQVDEAYVAYIDQGGSGGGDREFVEIPVSIAGIWQAKNPDEDYWFASPKSLKNVLIVPEQSFAQRITSYAEEDVAFAVWYLAVDGSKVHTDDIGYLLNRIGRIRQQMGTFLPGGRLDLSPEPAMEAYRRAVNLLMVLLYAFSVPIIGLVLAFISLVAGLSVDQRRNEIAVLRSRGATLLQVMGVAFIEATMLGGIALALSIPLAELIAQIVGSTVTFLDFSGDFDIVVDITFKMVRYGLVAIGLAVLAQVVPTTAAARHTIITYKQERARTMRQPWWQRAYLDVLLFIIAAYGSYILRQQGSLVLNAVTGAAPADPFQNPLLFLVPALGIFSLTLFILRLLPVLMSLIAWLATQFRGVGALLAARHLSRSASMYSAPLMLLVLTLALSAYTASLAQTMDNHLVDQTYYRTGADIRIVESGETATSSEFATGQADSEGVRGAQYYFLPVSEHLQVPGVKAAARVGRYRAFPTLSSGRLSGTFLGVDRADFGNVAFWRKDFAPSSLGAMMNTLAGYHNGILVPDDLLRSHSLTLHDLIRISIDIGGQRAPVDFEIVGVFDMFPTWYPNDEDAGPLFVGNLDYLFQQVGGQYPYNVWLKTDPNIAIADIIQGVKDQGLRVQSWQDSVTFIKAEQLRPQRQGLFGLLSVGFVAAALLTVSGFMLYAFFSFRQRFIELGVLRAVGLSARQMTAFLGWELIFLMGLGIGAGTGLGVLVSNLFIPYLQVGTGPSSEIPPFVVQISWPAVFQIYILFGVLFIAALGALVWLLMRMKIFQAIKLGETG